MIAGVIGAVAPALIFAQTRPTRIGMLGPRSLAESNYAPGVVRRLAELGYRDGAGTVIEYRSTDGYAERFPKLARDLIDLKCDVIFAIGAEQAARALQDARSPAPVVFVAVDYDPLEKGIVDSLRRPDRNTTGVYVPQNALVAKRLEIMREVIPTARRFLVFSDMFTRDQISAARNATDAAGVQLTVIEFSRQPYDYENAFQAGLNAKVQAAIVLSSPVFSTNRSKITALLAKHRLPGIASSLQHAEAGFLLGLNADAVKLTRRAAEIGVRILKGARPADIPVEQADEFELAVNAKTARMLGIKIPESVLARATRIIS
jgi:putative ABC transport system substrate-binding protein